MLELQSGQNHLIGDAQIIVGVDGEPSQEFAERLQVGAVLLNSEGRMGEPNSLVSADQPRFQDGAALSMRPPGEFHINLAALPPTVARIAVVLSVKPGISSGITFGVFAAIRAWLKTAAGDWLSLFPLPLASRGETAMILTELYRHRDQWKLRAVGQGFALGLPALAAHFGLRLPEAQPAAVDARPQAGSSFSGTGFCVHPEGYILTNHHVIEDAHEIMARSPRHRCALELVFADPSNDLALLRAETPPPGVALFRDGPQARLGEAVMVVGYPLGGLLGSGPQVTTGNVSSLIGPGDDTRSLQFTAPIQVGNSGGPLLDASGAVVGVVSSKLNVLRIHEMTGDVPQNVNFAIKAALARGFLEAAGIDYGCRSLAASCAMTDIATEARNFVMKIECRS
jgi:S1-C subfamily serine protease